MVPLPSELHLLPLPTNATMLHSCGILKYVMWSLSLSFCPCCPPLYTIVFASSFPLLLLIPHHHLLWKNLRFLSLPSMILYIFRLQHSPVVIGYISFCPLKTQTSLEHGMCSFQLSYHQNMACGRPLISFCWNNAITNARDSVNTPEGWVRRDQGTGQVKKCGICTDKMDTSLIRIEALCWVTGKPDEKLD